MSSFTNKGNGMGGGNGKGRRHQKGNGKRNQRKTRGSSNSTFLLSRELSTILRHGALKMKLPIKENGFINLAALVPKLKNLKMVYQGNNEEDILALVLKIVADCKKQRFTIQKCVAEDEHSSGETKVNTAGDETSDNGKTTSTTNTSTTTNKLTGSSILSQWEIRANQGHSMKSISIEGNVKITDPAKELPLCIHGTYKESVPIIMECGLNRMKRQHIHMAPGSPGQIDQCTGERIKSGFRNNCTAIIRINVQRAMEVHGLEFFRSSNGVILCAGDESGAIPPDCLTVDS
jgi:2'-phosphotransferase